MHQLVPQFIVDNYKKEELSGTITACVMFVDIAGFSHLTDKLMQNGTTGAEQLAEVMRGALAPVIDAIYAYDGFVATLAGDAITAIFPDNPVFDNLAFDNDRALSCVSQLPQMFETTDREEELSARFGLAYGDVHWGILHAKDQNRAAYYFTGEAIDLSVEAQVKAGNNEVLLHQSLTARARELFPDYIREQGSDYHHFDFRNTEPNLKIPELVTSDPAINRLFFSEQVANINHNGEFRQIVNVFIRLPTVRTETQLRLFIESLFAMQAVYGGFLNRLDFSDKGTHLHLFWGAPVTFENDVERALSFILALQSQTSIAISAGLSFRMSHAGFVGSSLREEYTCYGRGVNLAARLMVQAERGEIWLDEEIAKRADKHFDLELEGEFAFKGFSEKEKVFVLYERKEETESFFDSSLLGREEELKTLETFIQPIFENQYAGNLLIVGEAGIGKSHLLNSLEDSELTQTSLWLSCQTNQILVSSLNPFTYILKKYFGISDSQGENRNKRNFNRRLNNLINSCTNSELADELDRTQSFLGALVGLKWPDSLYEQLEPQSRLENNFLALIAFFQTLSLEQPLVILVEDIHWLDTDSKTFLVRLQRVLNSKEESFAIALFLTARPMQYPLPEELSYESLELDELKQQTIQLLTLNLLGKASNELNNLVFERSQGNPFFAEQIIRFLQDENLLKQVDGVWQLITQSAQPTVPSDVRTVLVARIDRLSKHLKDLVQTAAVLGREFEVRLLSQIMQTDDLSLRLDEAEKAAIWTALNELRYLFKHGLLRDTAYDMQLLSRRKVLHKLAAQSLEKLYEKDLSNTYAELAYHCEQAELTEKAKVYLELAGDSAKDAYQNEQSIDFYTRALALTAKEDRLHFELRLKRQPIYGSIGQHERQAEELEDLLSISERFDTDARIRVMLHKAEYLYTRSLRAEVIQIVEQTMQLCNEEKDFRHLAKCHILIGHAYYFYDNGAQRGEIIGHFLKAVNYAEALQDNTVKAKSLLYLGVSHRYKSDEQAKQYFEEALATDNNLSKYPNIHNRLGNIALRAKDYDKARVYFEQALAIGQEKGLRWDYGLTLYNFGSLYRKLQDIETAEAYFTRASQIGIELGNDLSDQGAQAAVGMLIYKGQLRESQDRFIEIYKDRSLKGKSFIRTLFPIINNARRLGDLSEAVVYSKQLLDSLPSRFVYDEMSARIKLAAIYIDLSDFDEAKEQLQRAQRILSKPEQFETHFGMAIRNTNLLDADIKLSLARIALTKQDETTANQLMNDVLAILKQYESQNYILDENQDPHGQLFYQSYLVLKSLKRPEASDVLNEAYRCIMDLSQKIGKTEEAQKQVWSEDRFRRGIVEAWQVEQLLE